MTLSSSITSFFGKEGADKDNDLRQGINTSINHQAANMTSDADGVTADINANRFAEDGEKLQTSSDDSKKRSIDIPSDLNANDDVNDDINDCGEMGNPPTTLGGTKKRRVSFMVGFANSVHHIPDRNEYDAENIKSDLFYSDADYERFRLSEQRRYDKMVAKRLQKMVMEKIQPSINEAVANGATLEDIEAMVPKTHEEMVAYMGGAESLRKMLEESSFSKLNNKETKTIRSARSSIAKTVPTLPSESNENEVENNTIEENKVIEENVNENKQDVNNVLGTTRSKRTIRSSRSSIEISGRNKGGRLSNAETDAAAASEEFMAMNAEEEDDLTEPF